MTTPRGEGFSIDEALGDPGFTPRAGDLDALLERVDGADVAIARAALQAIARIQGALAERIAERLLVSPSPERVEVALSAARRSDVDDAGLRAIAASLAACTEASARPKTRRAAAAALGKVLGAPTAREHVGAVALEAAVETLVGLLGDGDASLRRAAARALAAAGTRRAMEALASLQPGDDTVTARAQLAARRDAARPTEVHLPALDRAPSEPLAAVLACRKGLEDILVRQLGDTFTPRVLRPGRVGVSLERPPREALLAARSATGVAFPLAPVDLASDEAQDIGAAIARALLGEEATRVLRRFGPEKARFRIAFGDGAKHRSLVWAIAAQVERRSAGALTNDPRDAPWDLVVGLPPPDAARAPDRLPFALLELRPRFSDDRFPWRQEDVPAASHPTVAAAIAHLGGTRADDVVWDPFVGSAGELCERARLGPAAAYLGTDIDDAALEAARSNLEAAGIKATLTRTDARDYLPETPVSLILSNPPMGRRVLRRGGDVRRLLLDVLSRTRQTLAPGGRLVWASAHPADTREAGRAVGLRLTEGLIVDLGGFDVELQRFDRSD